MEYIDRELEDARLKKMTFREIVEECVAQIEPEMVESIRKRWLSGKSANGGHIVNKKTGKGYANKAYEKIKRAKNPEAGGNVDLTLTGALGKGLTVLKSGSDQYKIISTDSKYREIGSKYGFEEFDLSDQEADYFMNKIETLVESKLKRL